MIITVPPLCTRRNAGFCGTRYKAEPRNHAIAEARYPSCARAAPDLHLTTLLVFSWFSTSLSSSAPSCWCYSSPCPPSVAPAAPFPPSDPPPLAWCPQRCPRPLSALLDLLLFLPYPGTFSASFSGPKREAAQDKRESKPCADREPPAWPPTVVVEGVIRSTFGGYQGVIRGVSKG